MITEMQSTSEFIDHDIEFKFRPITYLYRQEFADFFVKFLEMKETVADEVRLRAIEEIEKLKDKMSVNYVYENQASIQSRMNLKVKIDSSKIILPIQKSGPVSEEAWIIDTGNMLIFNDENTQ